MFLFNFVNFFAVFGFWLVNLVSPSFFRILIYVQLINNSFFLFLFILNIIYKKNTYILSGKNILNHFIFISPVLVTAFFFLFILNRPSTFCKCLSYSLTCAKYVTCYKREFMCNIMVCISGRKCCILNKFG